MYAILVNEPGGNPSSYVLSTGASTSVSVLRLISERAEEFIDEQMEQEDETEDYSINMHEDLLSLDVKNTKGEVVIEFTAFAIDRVVA